MSDDHEPKYDFFPPAPASPPSWGAEADRHDERDGKAATGTKGRWAPSSRTPLDESVPNSRVPASGIPGAPPIRGSRLGAGLPNWGSAVAGFFAALFVAAALAAIIVPIVHTRHERSVWRTTRVTVPARFAGDKRSTTASSRSVAKSLAIDGIAVKDVGVYGAAGSRRVVIVALRTAKPMSASRQTDERAQVVRNFTTTGSTLQLTRQSNPGTLGGWLGCGTTTTQHINVCLATDAGSLVSVISGKDAGDPVALTRLARQQAVIRR